MVFWVYLISHPILLSISLIAVNMSSFSQRRNRAQNDAVFIFSYSAPQNCDSNLSCRAIYRAFLSLSFVIVKSDAPFCPNDIDFPSTLTVYFVSFCFDGSSLIAHIADLGSFGYFGLRWVTSTVLALQVLHTNMEGLGAAASSLLLLICSVILISILLNVK